MIADVVKMFSDGHSTPVLRKEGLESVPASLNTPFICIFRVPEAEYEVASKTHKESAVKSALS